MASHTNRYLQRYQLASRDLPMDRPRDNARYRHGCPPISRAMTKPPCAHIEERVCPYRRNRASWAVLCRATCAGIGDHAAYHHRRLPLTTSIPRRDMSGHSKESNLGHATT